MGFSYPEIILDWGSLKRTLAICASSFSLVNNDINAIICLKETRMYNWSIDLKELKKKPEKAVIWKLEQVINFGLNGEKLSKSLVKRYWHKIHIDPARKRFIKLLLWPLKS
jgi:hypothetical protein